MEGFQKSQNCLQTGVAPPQKHKKNYSTSISSLSSQSNLATLIKRYQSQQLEIFTNIDKKEIFSKVLKFLESIISHPKKLGEMLSKLRFDNGQDQDQIEESTMQSIKSHFQTESSTNVKKQPKGEKENEEPQKDKSQRQIMIKKLKSDCKKISIMMGDSVLESGDDWESNPLMSVESFKNLSSMSLPSMPLSLQIIEDIYEQPEPFLINLSICLLLKFLFYSKMTLTRQNVCWILAVGTIIAYKIYYDQPVEGLVDSFAYILGCSRQDIIDLEICFLNGIEHRAIIESVQYHLVLCKIVVL